MDKPVVFLDEIDSTNSYAKLHFNSLSDGCIVCAAAQTAGRGRLNRRWISPRGVNLYGSAVLKNCRAPFGATTALSLAALDTLRELAPELSAYLKWPNDIYVATAKLAGMLCESVTDSQNRLLGVVAGIGVNLNMTAGDLAAIDQAATGVLHETGRTIKPFFFAERLAFYLKRRYIIYSNKPESIFAEWKKENRLIGRELTVVGFSGSRTGIFEDVAPGGEMLLRHGGTLEKISSGDVKIDRTCLKNIF
ncbi:MAG: biotin--[acetyl-CoA-carboxylase] ligase [Victivallaceae bacterium]|nr:biotin--[acetyl-CoA-carboxylase] ligase [Victivallaceae bacterium]